MSHIQQYSILYLLHNLFCEIQTTIIIMFQIHIYKYQSTSANMSSI